MYTTVIHSRKDATPDACEALYRAVVSAICGQDATVLHAGKPLWEIDVSRHPFDHEPEATVRFRGASVEELQEELQRRERVDVPF